jgi:hypothetical protein
MVKTISEVHLVICVVGFSMFTLETSDDIQDLVVGTTIFGTGGGGSPQTGRALLESDLKAGLKLRVANLKEISEDALIVSPYKRYSRPDSFSLTESVKKLNTVLIPWNPVGIVVSPRFLSARQNNFRKRRFRNSGTSSGILGCWIPQYPKKALVAEYSIPANP